MSAFVEEVRRLLDDTSVKKITVESLEKAAFETARENLLRILQECRIEQCQACYKEAGDSEHGCPYQEDIHNDREYKCNCCCGCADKCRRDRDVSPYADDVPF